MEQQIKISRLENRCALCSKPFFVISELLAHIQTCENKAMVRKDPKSNSQQESLRVRENQCPVCQTIFQCSEDLMVHMTTHQDRNLPFQCIPCSLYFSKMFELNLHIDRHMSRNWACCALAKEICESKNDFKKDMACKNHQSIFVANLKQTPNELGPKKFHSCNICLALFNSRQTLKTHLRKKHAIISHDKLAEKKMMQAKDKLKETDIPMATAAQEVTANNTGTQDFETTDHFETNLKIDIRSENTQIHTWEAESTEARHMGKKWACCMLAKEKCESKYDFNIDMACKTHQSVFAANAELRPYEYDSCNICLTLFKSRWTLKNHLRKKHAIISHDRLAKKKIKQQKDKVIKSDIPMATATQEVTANDTGIQDFETSDHFKTNLKIDVIPENTHQSPTLETEFIEADVVDQEHELLLQETEELTTNAAEDAVNDFLQQCQNILSTPFTT